jgi:hypothetical protein
MVLHKYGKPCPSYSPVNEKIDDNDNWCAEKDIEVKKERIFFSLMHNEAEWNMVVPKDMGKDEDEKSEAGHSVDGDMREEEESDENDVNEDEVDEDD